MFCPKCGKQNLDTSKFCKVCGASLRDSGQVSGNFSHSGFSSSGFQVQIPSQPFNLVGQVIDGKYRLEAKLGTGGMGDVYQATRQFIGDKVAVKILHPHLAQNSQAAERFRREAQTAVRLKHNNVVTLYDVGISNQGWLYLVMELAEGSTLRQIFAQHKILPLDFAVTVTAQTCAALAEAHKLDIVHRDIKPENLIAKQTATGWQVKVLDFGIAKLQEEAAGNLTQDGNAMGTPQYMSPEQCLGEPLDGRSDVYSMGVLIYEMLCGTVPFRAATSSAVAMLHIQTPPAPLRQINPNVAPQVEAVVMRALEKRRENRQPTALALSQELIQAATQVFRAAPLTAPVGANLPVAAPPLIQQTSPANEVTPQFSSSGLILTSEEKPIQNEVVPAQISREIPQTSSEQMTVDFVAVQTPIAAPEIKSDEPEIVLPEKTNIQNVPQISTEIAAPTARQKSGEFAASPRISSETEISFLPQPEEKKKFLPFAIGAAALLVLLGVGGLAIWYLSAGAKQEEKQIVEQNKTENNSAPPAGMVLVPGGKFTMGGDKYVFDKKDFISPAHEVSVKPFFMDIYEVTREEYKKFVDATGYLPPKSWNGKEFPAGTARFPVTDVNWDAANEYAKWAGKRLPTEAEWEFAARGTDGRLYSWGNEWKDGMANVNKVNKGMVEVGSYKGASPFGVYDLIGNAWEWTATTLEPYPGGTMPNIDETKNIELKIIRGGTWSNNKDIATTTRRGFWGARSEADYSNTSFRCVKDAPTQ